MGLQRKQGVTIQEGQQFNIRQTVDEFRHQIMSYLYWKPGMEIYVSRVRRKQIPTYVFLEGYKRSRHSRYMNQQKVDKISSEGNGACRSWSAERILKRKELDGSGLVRMSEKTAENVLVNVPPMDEMTKEMVPMILKETSTRSNGNELQLVDRYKEINADSKQSNQGAENSDASSISPSSNTHRANGNGEHNVAIAMVLKSGDGVGTEPVEKNVISNRLSLTSIA
ncbi:hypothetical protein ACS0TY_033618 [Phlomoides rotata]